MRMVSLLFYQFQYSSWVLIVPVSLLRYPAGSSEQHSSGTAEAKSSQPAAHASPARLERVATDAKSSHGCLLFQDLQRLSAAHPLYDVVDPSGDPGSASADRCRRGHLQPEHERTARRGHRAALPPADDLAVRDQGHSDVALGKNLAAVPARSAGATFQANASFLAAHEEDPGEVGAAKVCPHDQGAGHQGLYAVLRDAESLQRVQVSVRLAAERDLSDAVVSIFQSTATPRCRTYLHLPGLPIKI